MTEKITAILGQICGGSSLSFDQMSGAIMDLDIRAQSVARIRGIGGRSCAADESPLGPRMQGHTIDAQWHECPGFATRERRDHLKTGIEQGRVQLIAL